MSEVKKQSALIEIHPGSPEWEAWLAHHRGTKTEMRMLACLTGGGRPWLARSKLPPATARADGLTRSFAQVAQSSLPMERPSVPEGAIDAIISRQEAREGRRVKEAEQTKRRYKQSKHADDVLTTALEEVQAGRMPHVNGGDELGTLEVLDIDKHGHIAIFAKVVNLRDDPVGQMAKRGQLGDAEETKARLLAARLWQGFYERAEIGSSRGIDPSSPKVDCSHVARQDTDARIAAQDRIIRLRQALGKIGDRLVTWVLGEKLNLAKVALRLGDTARMDQVVLGRRFRECLDTIAAELGIAHDQKGARGPRRGGDEFDDLARFADNPILHRAIGFARKPPRRP